MVSKSVVSKKNLKTCSREHQYYKVVIVLSVPFVKK